MRLPNLEIILVEPIYPGNVGAIARSAANYGVETIKIIGDLDVLCLESKRMALYGYGLLEKSQRYTSLLDAVKHCSLVIGTVHQVRFHRSVPRPAWEVIGTLASRIRSERTAVVFGREDNGLMRDEIDLCHYLANIPAHDDLSFNLAHSVTVFLYEISRCIYGCEPSKEPRRPSQDELAEFQCLVKRFLDVVGFFKGTQEDSVLTSLNDILYRSSLYASDLPLLKAILFRTIKSVEYLSSRVPSDRSE